MNKEDLNREAEQSPQDDDDFVELIDEEGNVVLFEHQATFEFRGESYIALSEVCDKSDDLEIILMKIAKDENGEDIYIQPEEDEEEEAFQYLLSITDEMEEGGE